MSKVDFSALVMQVMPALRDREVLLSEVARAESARASDTARAALAEIELVIRSADADYQHGGFDAALQGYQRARGLVYRLLHPTFDVSRWVRDRYVAKLPVGAAVEDALMSAAARLITVLRPQAVQATSLPALATTPLGDDLGRYVTGGFRRAAAGDAQLELVAFQALALMADGKPEIAVSVIEEALESEANRAGAHALASTRLNLAAAYLQSGSPEKARGLAEEAANGFARLKDHVGRAQALHAQAVGASVSGDQASADRLFEAAEKELGLPAPGRESMDLRSPSTAAVGARLPIRGGGFPRFTEVPVRREVRIPGGIVADRMHVTPTEVAGLNGRDPAILEPIRSRDVHSVTVRLPGRVDGWQVLPVPDVAERSTTESQWRVGVPVGERVIDLSVEAGSAISAADLRQLVYADRGSATRIGDLRLCGVDAASTSSYLTQLYGYALPLRVGDALHAVGLYEQAEASYIECAQYSFLNSTAEATAVWVRLARNVIEWGNTRYKAMDLEGAKAQYGRLISADGTEPTDSVLYGTPSLADPVATARELIAHLGNRPLPPLQWQIAGSLLDALSYLQQIAAGLDFFGLSLSPVHTFEYLQSVARGFAQDAIQAEREYVNFRSRQQVDAATRRDLETTRAMAYAEAAGREAQYRSAQADTTAAQHALALAQRRRADAISQRDAYASASWTQIWSQAAATAQGMGSDSWFNEISELADKLDRGESISGERGKLAAAYTLRAGRRTREYELAKMQDSIDELTAAIPVAQAQLTSAQQRAVASEIAWQAAVQRAQMSDSALAAFDSNEFTPDAWAAMADVMRDISRDYLWRAIRLAKLMERAFNFEHDSVLAIIKDDYGHAIANASGTDALLMGGDSLRADIESFTYVAITTTRRKQSQIKDMLSLAREFPAHFEQFRQTGVLAFETDLYEFDRLHPGFYQQRMDAVEIEFVGLVPEEGLNGTLTAGGVTRYRARDGETGQRVHQVDTMALSDFQLRNDMFLYQAPTGVRGLFQGIGVGTTWELHLPKRSNDFDFRRIVDVRLVIYYSAIYDLGLRSTVLTRPPRAGELAAVRDFNLRYDAPDAWYGFYRSGAVDFVLDEVRLPANQQAFTINDVQIRLQPRAEIDPAGITLSVTPPGGTAAAVTTDARGVADLSDAVPGLAGTSPLGSWRIEVTGGDSVTEDGVLQPGRIITMQLGLDYTFEYPAEEA